jgi:hypothetical protein
MQKPKFLKVASVCFLIVGLLISINGITQKHTKVINKVVNLLDDKFTYWDKWIGVPDPSVKGLPALVA